MTIIGSIFKCNNNDDIKKQNESSNELDKELEIGKAERQFMKEQIEDLKINIDKLSLKALTIFGVEKDIAIIKNDLNYIKRDFDEIKGDVKSLTQILLNFKK